MAQKKLNVGLFITCLADLFRPSVAMATVKLLEKRGCRVHVPAAQSCCGQPAFNSGARIDATEIAKSVIEAFESFDYVVLPSGSCAGMIAKHYPELFAGNPAWDRRARALARKTFEVTQFLVDVLKLENVDARCFATATYHDSCSGLRELGIKAQPRKLLNSVKGLELSEMTDSEVCCGFGGTFCIKYADISTRIVDDKVKNIQDSGADLLLAGDLGCLLNMAGRLKRCGIDMDVRHVVEVLAGMTDELPPIAGSAAEKD